MRHDAGNDEREEPAQAQGIVSKWRQKERLKTTAVALVLCLNIGVDPPDVIKISPCARLECWVDPLSMQPPKALDTIGTLYMCVQTFRPHPVNPAVLQEHFAHGSSNSREVHHLHHLYCRQELAGAI